ncbi:hypothetical protein [Brevundimonas vesicularis]|uniref:Uncharacterized protein n=1 Tax=Brevundimonas vesicularis TaxID=41276 RepID=A0A1Z3U8W6_BREVE|nr:hypothetical protein [Brevundimonas vesicularis]ASE39374.1 hypothetical protein CEP68_07575 [Brevundimonas vesicularis]
MIVYTLHPLDAVLAEIGTLVRRGRHGSMDEKECTARIERIRQGIVGADIDQDGRIRDRLDVLARTLEDGSLTRDWFDTITKSIRDRVARARDSLTPDTNRLGENRAGRRYGGLTVFDGGRCDTPDTHQRSL